MKKFVVSVVLGMGMLLALASPAAAKQGDTTYYVGAGDTKHSEVSFKLRDGRIREALIGAGQTTCAGNRKVSLWKSFVGIQLDGNHFHRRSRHDLNDVFVFGGHVRGASASGRMRITTGRQCSSGVVRWAADRVSRDDYQHFGHHR